MKSPWGQRIIVGAVILQAIVTVVIAIFFFNYLINPNSDFNKRLSMTIKEVVGSVRVPEGPQGVQGPQGIAGINGRDGKDGRDGVNGANGSDGTNGINGQNATAAQIAAAVSQYLRENPPPQGDKGDAGANGIDGESPEIRCNPETRRLEYKKPSDEDWSFVGAACRPVVEEPNEQQIN